MAQERKFLPANPLMKKIQQNAEEAQATGAASYLGIIKKCLIYLAMIVAGIAATFMLNKFPDETSIFEEDAVMPKGTWLLAVAALGLFIAPLIASFFRKAAPVAGSIYCFSVGYVYCFLGNSIPEYKGPIFMAMCLTVGIFMSIIFLYMNGKIRVTGKFRQFATVALGALFFSSLLLLICSFIPGLNAIAATISSNPVLSIGISILGVIVAVAFVFMDIDDVHNAVEGGAAKEWEWSLAFAIMFSVIWLFLEILSLVLKLVDRD